MNRSYSDRIKKIALLAMFVTLAYVLQFVFRIHVLFLTFDAKDAVLAIGAMIFGPLDALLMSFLVAFLEFITISGTGFWGLVMNFCGTAAFTVTASLIYKYRKTMMGAIVALFSAAVSMTAVMLMANLIITPIYTSSTTAEVAQMIPTLLLPFNVAKAILNAGLVLLLYKPITTALRKARLISGEASTYKFGKNTVIMLITALLMLGISIAIFVVLGGVLSWF